MSATWRAYIAEHAADLDADTASILGEVLAGTVLCGSSGSLASEDIAGQAEWA